MDASSQSPRPRLGTRGVPREVREPEILRAAGEVFAAEGYHGASMDDIAARADVSKPLLYNYFGSKQSLYISYIEQAGTGLLADIRAATDDDRPADERLWAGIRAFFRFVDEHRAGWVVLYAEASSQGGPFAAEVAHLRERIAGTVASLLDQAVAQAGCGSWSAEEAESLAHAFVGAGESLANWWLEHGDVPAEHVARRLMDLAWVGLGDLIHGEGWSPPEVT